MSERGADDIAKARQLLKFLSRDPIPPPVTANTRKSLERLAKAVDQLDPAARFYLGEAMGGPAEAPVNNATKAINSCLASLKVSLGRKEDDLLYELAIEHLGRAWWARHSCSPLGTKLRDFQEFCVAVTKDYDVRVPGERQVRRWCKRPPGY